MVKKTVWLVVLFAFAVGCKDGPCPDKSEFLGGKPPADDEQWCEKKGEDGIAVKDGPYIVWFTANQKRAEGQYKETLGCYFSKEVGMHSG